MSSNIIKLKSQEGEIVDTSRKAVLMAQTIKDMLENIGDDLEDSTEIPVNNISTKTLKKVVEWIEHWKDEPQPSHEEIKEKLADTIDNWDEEYLVMELQDLYDLISAANFLNIPGLLWLSTRAVAYMIKGKGPEEIRRFFNIENDWTPEELEQVRRENEWCEEK